MLGRRRLLHYGLEGVELAHHARQLGAQLGVIRHLLLLLLLQLVCWWWWLCFLLLTLRALPRLCAGARVTVVLYMILLLLVLLLLLSLPSLVPLVVRRGRRLLGVEGQAADVLLIGRSGRGITVAWRWLSRRHVAIALRGSSR